MTKIEIKESDVKATKVEPKVIKEKKVSKFGVFLKNNWGLIVLFFLGILVMGGTGTFLYFFVIRIPIQPAEIVKLTGNYIETSKVNAKTITTALLAPSIPKTEPSPLNGVLFTKKDMATMLKRRPVAVMINNHVQARPQSGLYKADIIYEAVTESGITRYMAIFWSNGANKVGPVRSARQYYLEWLSPFDPIYIHDGCASTSDPRTNACGNIYVYDIKDIRTLGYWRTTDRVAPHNEYNSILSAWDYGKKYDWDSFPTKTESLLFKKDASYDNRGDKTRVKIRFRTDLPNYGMYDSEWIYNKDTNMYSHKIGGATDIDKESKTPIRAKTVIFEEVTMTDAYDGKGRVIITTIGHGKAIILMDGKIINAQWKKSNRTDRTEYVDAEGKEIAINRGLLWISALPKDRGKFDIIEQ